MLQQKTINSKQVGMIYLPNSATERKARIDEVCQGLYDFMKEFEHKAMLPGTHFSVNPRTGQVYVCNIVGKYVIPRLEAFVNGWNWAKANNR